MIKIGEMSTSENEKDERLPRHHRRWPLVVVLVILVVIVALCGVKIYQVSSVNSQADNFYRELSAQAVHTSGGDGKTRTIDWDILTTENANTAAWIYQAGTQIDYPVIAASDYSEYLTELPDGTQNPNGTPFIDFNNAADFSDALTVIYGNDTSNQAMFSSLTSYSSQSYFDQHPSVDLFTPHGDYTVELVYGVHVPAEQWRKRAFMTPGNLPALLEYAKTNTTFTSDKRYSSDSQWVAFVTTSSQDGIDGAHDVVLGVLEKR
jgi:sortase B